MPQVYLGLGSNIGDRKSYLLKSIEKLKNHPKIKIQKLSSIYETKPLGKTNQRNFLNMVVEGRTSLSPQELMAYTQSVENSLGRIRKEKWGPRRIDIDILLYNNSIIKEKNLIIPHPGLMERDFFLIPLQEISPKLIFPSGHSLGNLIEKNISKKRNIISKHII